MNQKLVMTRGLPGSGKTTWAKEYIKTAKTPTKIICKDDLRAMLDNGAWSKEREKFINHIWILIIKEVLFLGFDVIVADTNLDPKHEATLRVLAGSVEATFEVQDFTHVPVSTCILRDAGRAKPVGPKVIKDMYNRYLRINETNQPIINRMLENCIICDLDGTLALMGNNRGPFDWNKVDQDVVNIAVKRMLFCFITAHNERARDLNSPLCKLIILSGRDSICSTLTAKWLTDNNIPYDFLFMRAEGDNRADDIIKEELYNAHIKDKYNVLAVFDDRLRVCRLWHRLGLPLFRVGDPEADF